MTEPVIGLESRANLRVVDNRYSMTLNLVSHLIGPRISCLSLTIWRQLFQRVSMHWVNCWRHMKHLDREDHLPLQLFSLHRLWSATDHLPSHFYRKQLRRIPPQESFSKLPTPLRLSKSTVSAYRDEEIIYMALFIPVPITATLGGLSTILVR